MSASLSAGTGEQAREGGTDQRMPREGGAQLGLQYVCAETAAGSANPDRCRYSGKKVSVASVTHTS